MLSMVVAVSGLGSFWAYWARRHYHNQWILRSYTFSGKVGKAGVPALQSRLDGMAEAVCRQAQAGGDDEILVVGHSMGTIMAVSVMARAFRLDPRLAEHGPAVSMLTLGHCTPLMSNLPEAGWFRDELALLSQQPGLCWVDFSDPLDDYAFHGVHPVGTAGLPRPRAGLPQMLSPDFDALFQPGPHQKPGMNLHEIHQQYLGASMPGDPYDYFAMTGGPITLADRFPTRADDVANG